MSKEITTKELIEGVMAQNNELLKGLIPTSSSSEVEQQINSILADLGRPVAPQPEQEAPKRYTDAQVAREVTNILNDLG